MYKNYKSKANTLILYNYVLLFNAETNMHFQNNPTHELQINRLRNTLINETTMSH